MAFLKKFNLSTQIIGLCIICASLPFLVLAGISLNSASNALKNEVSIKLEALRDIKAVELNNFFSTVEKQVMTMAEGTAIKEAAEKFTEAFNTYVSETETAGKTLSETEKGALLAYYTNAFGAEYEAQNGEAPNMKPIFNGLTETEKSLQHAYISGNANPLGNKHVLNAATGPQSYHQLHARYHPSIRTFLEEFGFYDIFIVSQKTGHIVYSVYKEMDYATSLINGPYADTNFADVYKKARVAPEGEFILSDLAPYMPSYEAPAGFVGSPIFSENGERLGVLVFQIPVEKINKIVADRSGLGETGEAYVVGADHLLRTDSVQHPEHSVRESLLHPEEHRIDEPSLTAAINGETGVTEAENYAHVPVISAYRPYNHLGLEWAIVTEISTEEAYAPIVALRNTTLIILIISIIFVVALSILTTRSITKPIGKVVDAIRALAAGNLTARCDVKGRGDEIGTLASATNETIDKLSGVIGHITGSAVELSATSTQLQNTSTQFIQATDGIAQKTDSMLVSANELGEDLQSMAGTAKEMSDNSNTIASAIEEMSASISDVSQNCSHEAEIAQKAKTKADETNEAIGKLNTSAKEIVTVVDLISGLADQTNLLALNATIEAASAGEAGKGFAVVASEVKDLARRSAEATESINKQVQKIMGDTEKSVGVIQEISSIIDEIYSTSESIASAVQEQSAASNEIAMNTSALHQAAEMLASKAEDSNVASNSVAEDTQNVSEVCKEVAAGASESHASAEQLSEMAKRLEDIVGQFQTKG